MKGEEGEEGGEGRREGEGVEGVDRIHRVKPYTFPFLNKMKSNVEYLVVGS